MKVVFVGSGNLATHLATALHEKGICISQVYSRTTSNAKMLAEKLQTTYTDDPDQIVQDADIYFYALKDDALAEFLKKVNLPDAIHVHTSGSVSISIFRELTYNYGVFYPVQTFTKDKLVDFSTTPICIEAANSLVEEELIQLAELLTNKIYNINSEQRKVIHLAAVFACNFSNYMYDASAEILNDAGLNFEILKPLISETADKIRTLTPYNAQTGPAVRFDKNIMDKQIAILKPYPALKKIYKLISKNIYLRHLKK